MIKEVKWVVTRWYTYGLVLLWALIVLYINGFTIPLTEWIVNIPVVFFVFVVIILLVKFLIELIINVFKKKIRD